jgi:hypothetical protein
MRTHLAGHGAQRAARSDSRRRSRRAEDGAAPRQRHGGSRPAPSSCRHMGGGSVHRRACRREIAERSRLPSRCVQDYSRSTHQGASHDLSRVRLRFDTTSRAKAATTLGLDVSAGCARPSSRSLWRGDASAPFWNRNPDKLASLLEELLSLRDNV